MSALNGKRVLIFQQRGWGKGIGRFLARKLYAEGARLAAITSTKRAHDVIVAQSETEASYELIVDHDEVLGRPRRYLAGERYSLKEICQTLGIDTIWPLVWSLRMFVRTYGEKYYYSFRQNIPDEGIVEYIQALYKCARMMFDEFKPDIIVAPNFVSLYHMMFNLLGEKRGVPMIALTDSRVRGWSMFTYNYLENKGPFYERVDALNAGSADSTNRERARRYIAEFREQFRAPLHTEPPARVPLVRRIKRELSPYAQIARWYLKHNQVAQAYENVGIWPGYRPPRIILRDHYAHKYYAKAAERFPYHRFEEIKEFVYFPLQVQPEIVIDVMAPFCSNQIETARQVAMSLPGDYTLVVKEHPAMVGFRPPSYYEKLARTVNVKLVDYRISSEDILKRTDLVIGPGGTSFAEAAFYRKPVIQLGGLGTTLKLPNVFPYTDMATLTKKIQEALTAELHTAEYERRLENYVAAAYDTGTDLDYAAIWEGRDQEKMEVLWEVYKKEIERALSVSDGR